MLSFMASAFGVSIPSSDNQRRHWHPTPVLLPGKSHGWRNLVGCSPWGRTESDMTERLHFHFSLSCLGEGNGNPLQCSCLENPRDRGAWWAAVYGVTQSRTRLKRLSSSSSHKSTSNKFETFFLLYYVVWNYTVYICNLKDTIGNNEIFLICNYRISICHVFHFCMSGISFIHSWLSPL